MWGTWIIIILVMAGIIYLILRIRFFKEFLFQ